ncbi:MAG: hypothetical protein K0U84_09135 [Actinomycetia bacterium]|nr:hypothetical protein [Actinomycetes bacterium]
MTPAQAVEAALQLLLDSCGDGWTLANYVVVMGLQKVDDDGVASEAWVYPAPNQPHWVTTGLLVETDGLFARTED